MILRSLTLWQRRALTIGGVIVTMYLMVYIRVRTESAREFRQAEQHYYWWTHPKEKRQAMIEELKQRSDPQEHDFSESERREKIMTLVVAQREKKSLEAQHELRQKLAEYYFIHLVSLTADLEALVSLGRVKESEKESLARDLGDVFEMSYEIERFKREMTEYYYNHPETVAGDHKDLLTSGVITKAEHKWLLRELVDIQEVFESDIKTAFYGYATVLDIWLDPPAWPPSILRNSALANATRKMIGTRDEREDARRSGTSSYPITQEFETWVRKVTPPVPGARRNDLDK